MRTEGITAATPLQSLLWPNLLKHRSVLAISEAGQGRTLAWVLPLVSNLSEEEQTFGSLGPRVLVLCTGAKPAHRTAKLVREVIDRSGLELTVVLGAPDGMHTRRIDVLVSSLEHLAEFGRGLEQVETFLEFLDRCGTLVLEEADTQLKEPEQLQKLHALMTTLQSSEEAGNLQLVAVASSWGPALSTLCAENLRMCCLPTVVVINLQEACTHGKLSLQYKTFQTQEEKCRELVAALASWEGRLVICCRSKETDLLSRLLSTYHPLLVTTSSAEELWAWDKQPTVPLLLPDDILSNLTTVPEADILVMWDVPSSAELALRLTLVHSMRNLLRPSGVVQDSVVTLLVSVEDVTGLALIKPWLQRCGAGLLGGGPEEGGGHQFPQVTD